MFQGLTKLSKTSKAMNQTFGDLGGGGQFFWSVSECPMKETKLKK